ncbi:18s rrna biogenesis protein rcl1 [Plasmopara halstedii]|uniref:18s rrna biogenesis protein rcl1 n=1 Tax=Plasmopara halstedii TaxID=4781 RepID=A0A0N7L387_PLAHL|nr:18s rrna biogenesis protein rcl1 [Plasmopara halstedii]CEG35187.1 18s rrna biogenesis protein rcl1 [Plasmopara halstedii]|eukprot:XP_024571556.1 18s rrna biogenesis protein rcl1 [Plasmopara halstedii]
MASRSTSRVTVLRFQGCAHFRQRLICAILSGRPLIIENIRSEDENPGLAAFEANLLRLLDRITSGSRLEINETGTKLKLQPGLVLGGQITHDCGTGRAIGWFLEVLAVLAPFAKQPLHATLDGVTNDHIDNSVDNFKATTLPLLRHFGLDDGLDFVVKKRGAQPLGGGQVIFRCPLIRQLKAISLTEEGFIKRIRGVAYSTRVSPQTSNRIVESSRGLFNKLLPDVYIYSDHFKGVESGHSPGFALSLVAETTTGVFLGSEAAAEPGDLPEDVATRASHALCEEIQRGGCVDSTNQTIVLLLMALGPEDVAKVRIGKLTPHSISCLRLLREFFGVTFKIKPDPETKTVLLSCLGVGFKNLAKKVT